MRFRRGLAWAALLLVCGPALAAGLQVTPISLQLQASQHAAGLWLSNTGDAVLHAQVRVQHWSQPAAESKLTASRALLVSPPMVTLQPGQKQLVRVIRVAAPPSGAHAVEGAFRLSINELPSDVADQGGLNFVLHYSVPVFLEPENKSDTAPQLGWSLHRDGDHAVLTVTNSGDGHARLSAVHYVDGHGKTTSINTGLFGYVLPGASMHWTLKPSATVFAGGGILKVEVNGETVAQPISLDTSAR